MTAQRALPATTRAAVGAPASDSQTRLSAHWCSDMWLTTTAARASSVCSRTCSWQSGAAARAAAVVGGTIVSAANPGLGG